MSNSYGVKTHKIRFGAYFSYKDQRMYFKDLILDNRKKDQMS